MTKLNCISGFALLTLFCTTALAGQRDRYIGVDFRDVARYAGQEFPEAKTVLRAMKLDPQRFYGPNYKNIDKVYGVELYDAASVSGGVVTLPTVALVKLTSDRLYFRKLEINVTQDSISQVKMIGDDIDLKNIKFSVQVGIYQRKVILEDAQDHIKIIYPLGLGGVNDVTDPKNVKFSTPPMGRAYIEKDKVIARREHPAYYKGEPFIEISRPLGNYTEIAFHIEINDTFRRSFESHGCMRLRLKDLTEFYNIVMNSVGPIDVDIKRDLPTGGDHPFPKHDGSYEHYKNFGTRENPVFKRDKKDHLIIMEVVDKTPAWLNTENEKNHAEQLAMR